MVLDPLAKILQMDDIADPKWAFKNLARLRDSLKPKGITSLLMAHPAHKGSSKGDRYFSPSGTAAQLGIFDYRFGLEKFKRQSKLTLYKKREIRWIKEGTYVELPHTSHGAGFGPAKGTEHWPFMPVPLPLAPKVREILTACPLDKPFTMPELYGREEGDPLKVRKNTVLEAFKDYLVPEDLIEKVGGSGKKGDPYLFQVTAAGKDRLAEKH